MTASLGIVYLVLTAGMAAGMVISWGFQLTIRNSGWTDVFWTFLTGAACVAAALMPMSGNAGPAPRQILAAVMAGLWSLRLGLHLFFRVANGPEDARYAYLRGAWAGGFQRRMLGLSLIQAPVGGLLAMSVLLAARAPGAGLGPRDLAGVATFAIALVGEGVADRQLASFRAEPANRGAVCDIGLWSWSRHPNYFFEALVWLTFPVMALRPADPWSWLSLAAPVGMALLLRFGSGVPPLEAAMLRSRGEAYRRYQARVSPLLPLPPRREETMS